MKSKELFFFYTLLLELLTCMFPYLQSKRKSLPIYGNMSRLEKSSDFEVMSSVTLESDTAFFMVKNKIYGAFEISLMIRTTADNGIILFAGNTYGRDFLCLELHRGHARYLFDVGSGPRVIEAFPPHFISNSAWHRIKIFRPNLTTHWLIVDDVIKIHDNLPAMKSVYYDFADDWLFVGGAPDHVIHKQIKSGSKGIQGCLGDLRVNGMNLKKLVETERLRFMREFRDHLSEGCSDPRNDCLEPSRVRCLNGGECSPLWSTHSCDCSMSGHVGEICQEEGTSVTFSTQSFLRFILPSQRHTKQDRIALAFKTSQISSRSTLLFLNSLSSNDFIELSLTPHDVEAVYNVGSTTHSISLSHLGLLSQQNFNVIRFQRDEQNASLQLNQSPRVLRHPPGIQLTTFNHQESIFLGARKLLANNSMSNFFHGTMTGVNFNGINILDAMSSNESFFQDERGVTINRKRRVNDSIVTIRPYFSFTNEENSGCEETMCSTNLDSISRGESKTTGTKCLYDDADCSSYSIGKVADLQFTNHEQMAVSSTTLTPILNYQQLPIHTIPSLTHHYSTISTEHENYSTDNNLLPFLETSSVLDVKLDSPSPIRVENVTQSSEQADIKLTLNLSLTIGTSLVLVVILTGISWIFYRYKKRGEGSYKLNTMEHNYDYCTNPTYNMTYQQTKTAMDPKKSKSKKSSTREWYV